MVAIRDSVVVSKAIDNLKGSLGPIGLDATSTISPRIAYTSILVIFLAGWGDGTLSAIAYLTGQYQPGSSIPRPWVESSIKAFQIFSIGLALILAGLLLTFIAKKSIKPLGLTLPVGRKQWINEFRLGLITIPIIMVSFQLGAEIFGEASYPGADAGGGATFIPLLVSMLMAGPTEEILLVAVPVVVLRAANQSWTRIFLVCLTMRLIFHIYYGWNSITLLIWAITVLVLFTRHHRILGIIVSHSAFDGFNTLAVNLKFPVTVIFSWYLTLILSMIAIVFYWDGKYLRPERENNGK